MNITLTYFMTTGIQFAIMYLFVIFLTEDKGISESLARNALAAYFICLALGRFICARIVAFFSPARLIMTLLVSLALLLIIVWAAPGMISLVFFILTGFACSGLVPNMLALVSRTLTDDVQGSALGVMAMIGGFGGILVTYGATLAAASFGYSWGFLTFIFATIISIIFFVVYIKEQKSVNAPGGL